MNKYISVAAVVLIVLAGWWLFSGNTVNYVATVTDEVTQLETELSDIEAAVAAGTLTPESAAQAKASIAARLDTINNAVSDNTVTYLTAAKREQLLAALARLEQILRDYEAALAVLDETTTGADTITEAITQTVATITEQVEEVMADYEPNEMRPAQEQNNEDTATTTDDLPTSTNDSTENTETASASSTETHEEDNILLEADITTDTSASTTKNTETESRVTTEN